jgi:hypothetical protein
VADRGHAADPDARMTHPLQIVQAYAVSDVRIRMSDILSEPVKCHWAWRPV